MRISLIRRLVGVLAVAALGVLPLTLLGPAANAAAAAKAPKAAKPSSGSTFNPNLLLQGSTNTAEPSIRTDRFGYWAPPDRKSTRLNSSHGYISYAVFCLKKKKKHDINHRNNFPL